jgi:prolipoprotein diacylglyceryltransferase
MAVSALFLMGYGVARFVMEFFRQPDADQGFILFLDDQRTNPHRSNATDWPLDDVVCL